MAPSLTFIVCTEAGPLECQSTLLATSIRTFGGVLRDAAIRSFRPRPGRALRPLTHARFRDLEVAHQELDLNKEFQDYAFANKVLVASYAERHLESEVIVFMDSDQVVLDEPVALLLDDGEVAALRPVHTKNIGSDGTSDANDEYWRSLYRLLGVAQIRYVRTTVDGERVLAYWNAGLVAVRRSAGIFAAWEHNFRRVAARGLVPPGGRFFQEQSALAATLSALCVPVRTLPRGYNYSLVHHERMPAAERARSLSEIVTLHYHRAFDSPGGQRRLDAFSASVDHRLKWLRAQLVASGVSPAGF